MKRSICICVIAFLLLESLAYPIDPGHHENSTEEQKQLTPPELLEPEPRNSRNASLRPVFNQKEHMRKLRNEQKSKHFLPLPLELNNVKDISEPSKVSDTPVFWHVSKSGGTTMEDIFTKCFDFVVASEVGVLDGHGEDEVR